MEDNPKCAVCGSSVWEAIGRGAYRRSDMDRLARFARRRREVLFDVWFRGSSEIVLEAVLCAECGFVTYRPRPGQEDLDRKYEYLGDETEDMGGEAGAQLISRLRAAEMYRMLRAHVSGRRCRLLDFGGGRGELLVDFVKRGHECFVLDYVEQALPGVKHVGRRVKDMPEGLSFDLIVCSHVLEHLAEPRKVLAGLRSHLAEGGVLYVEVPLEIWARSPLGTDPVMHINFFAPGSLRVLLEECGLRVAWCRKGLRVGWGGGGFAVRALARGRPAGAGGARESKRSAGATRALLSPGRTGTWLRALQPRRLYPLMVALRHPSLYGGIWAAMVGRIRRPGTRPGRI